MVPSKSFDTFLFLSMLTTSRSGMMGGNNTSSMGRDGRDMVDQGGYGNTSGTTGSSGNFGTMDNGSSTGTSKPSMMDKLNPKVDATGDGKAGFMK